MQSQLDQWLEAAKKQQEAAIDYATQQGISELERAQEKAAEEFQVQRNQVDIGEAKALDNQALYAEARGDKGGIGQAQYASVQNAAAQNRLAINKAQTQLSTDTARQIADLRAQGEFEKADNLLSLTQSYLSQLQQLQQWAAEFNLSVDQFNTALQQWQAEFEMSRAEVTGIYQGEKTYAAQMAEQALLSDAGWALLDAGILPSESQLAAMGITADQANSILAASQLGSGSHSSGGGGGGGDRESNDSSPAGVSDERYKNIRDTVVMTGIYKGREAGSQKLLEYADELSDDQLNYIMAYLEDRTKA